MEQLAWSPLSYNPDPWGDHGDDCDTRHWSPTLVARGPVGVYVVNPLGLLTCHLEGVQVFPATLFGSALDAVVAAERHHETGLLQGPG